jgi:hypothetical protein
MSTISAESIRAHMSTISAESIRAHMSTISAESIRAHMSTITWLWVKGCVSIAWTAPADACHWPLSACLSVFVETKSFLMQTHRYLEHWPPPYQSGHMPVPPMLGV